MLGRVHVEHHLADELELTGGGWVADLGGAEP